MRVYVKHLEKLIFTDTWNKGLCGWYFIVSSLVGVCCASGKPVQIPSSHLIHHPPLTWATEHCFQTEARSRSGLWNGKDLCQVGFLSTDLDHISIHMLGSKRVPRELWQKEVDTGKRFTTSAKIEVDALSLFVISLLLSICFLLFLNCFSPEDKGMCSSKMLRWSMFSCWQCSRLGLHNIG